MQPSGRICPGVRNFRRGAGKNPDGDVGEPDGMPETRSKTEGYREKTALWEHKSAVQRTRRSKSGMDIATIRIRNEAEDSADSCKI